MLYNERFPRLGKLYNRRIKQLETEYYGMSYYRVLLDVIASLDEVIDFYNEMADEVEQLETEFTDYVKDNDENIKSIKEELALIKTDLTNLDDLVHMLSETINGNTEAIGMLSVRVIAVENGLIDVNEKLTNAIQDYTDKINGLSTQITSIIERVSGLEGLTSTHTNQIAEIQNAIVAINANIQTIIADEWVTTPRIADGNVTWDKLDADVQNAINQGGGGGEPIKASGIKTDPIGDIPESDVQSVFENHETRIKDNTTNIAKNTDDIVILKDNTTNIAKNTDDIVILKDNVSSINNITIPEQNRRIKGLQSRLDTVENDISDTNASIDEVKGNLENLESTVEGQRIFIDNNANNITDVTTKVDSNVIPRIETLEDYPFKFIYFNNYNIRSDEIGIIHKLDTPKSPFGYLVFEFEIRAGTGSPGDIVIGQLNSAGSIAVEYVRINVGRTSAVGKIEYIPQYKKGQNDYNKIVATIQAVGINTTPQTFMTAGQTIPNIYNLGVGVQLNQLGMFLRYTVGYTKPYELNSNTSFNEEDGGGSDDFDFDIGIEFENPPQP